MRQTVINLSGRLRLREIVERHSAHRWDRCMPQRLDPAHRLRCEQHITANCTDFGWHMVDHDNPVPLAHSMHNLSLLVFTWATIDTTFHFNLLSVGLTHLGGIGSYT